MPMYQYKCTNVDCSHEHEELKKVEDRFTDTCPVCQSVSHLQLSTAAVVFKGPGFYVNDYPKDKK